MTLAWLAFGAGVLATVNPCGFAMLPAFLGYFLGANQTDVRSLSRLARGFGVGVAVSAGFAGVFTVTGVLVAVGLRELSQAVPWAAVLVGGLLVVAGIAAVTGREYGLRLSRGYGSGRGRRHMVVFGAAYAVASLSCTLGVMLAVIAQAAASGSLLQLLLVFAAYAAGAATILVAVAVAAAFAKTVLTKLLRPVGSVVSRLGGVLLIASGGYLVAYWLPALRGNPPGRIASLVEGPSAWLTGFLYDHVGIVALAAVVLLAIGVLIAAAKRRRDREKVKQP